MLLTTQYGELCTVTRADSVWAAYFNEDSGVPIAELVLDGAFNAAGEWQPEVSLTQAYPVVIAHAVLGDLTTALAEGEEYFDLPLSLRQARRELSWKE